MNKKGFTLIEMLVVIAIIAVLVAIVLPTVTSHTEKAGEATDLANIRSIYSEVATSMLLDEEMEPRILQLKQKRDDWQTDTAQKTLEKLGEVKNVPEGGGSCKIYYDSTIEKVVFEFSGEPAPTSAASGSQGGSEGSSEAGSEESSSASAGVNRAEGRYIGGSTSPKDIAAGLAAFVYDTFEDKMNGNFSSIRHNGARNQGGDLPDVLAADYKFVTPGGMINSGLTYNSKDGNWSDQLEGTDLTADIFTTAVSGAETYIWLDTNTKKPIAITYYQDGTANSDYMITYLDENGNPAETRDLGKKTGMYNAFPYHKDYVLEYFDEDTPPTGSYGGQYGNRTDL